MVKNYIIVGVSLGLLIDFKKVRCKMAPKIGAKAAAAGGGLSDKSEQQAASDIQYVDKSSRTPC